MPPSYSSARPDVTRMSDLARRAGAELVAVAAQQRSITDVAFDAFAFEPEALLIGDTLLERGINAVPAVLAVASVAWPEMPASWTAFQSRSGPDHLGMRDAAPIGDDEIDDRYAVDADDADELERWLHPEIRAWLIDSDEQHGPLTIVFDNDVGAADSPGNVHVSAIYVARVVTDDDGALATVALVDELAELLRSTRSG